MTRPEICRKPNKPIGTTGPNCSGVRSFANPTKRKFNLDYFHEGLQNKRIITELRRDLIIGGLRRTDKRLGGRLTKYPSPRPPGIRVVFALNLNNFKLATIYAYACVTDAIKSTDSFFFFSPAAVYNYFKRTSGPLENRRPGFFSRRKRRPVRTFFKFAYGIRDHREKREYSRNDFGLRCFRCDSVRNNRKDPVCTVTPKNVSGRVLSNFQTVS